ncbi:MAG: restriction endonuclease subunit S [Rhodopirellula sp.]|nr:restriction endonuclease subunit S [Rhodopirellula sp.]
MWNDGITLDDAVYIPESIHERMQNTRVIANDILLNITGASLGRCAKVPDDFPEANVSQHVTIIRPLLPAFRHFLHLCLLSPMGQSMIWGRQVGMAREGLSKKVLEQFEIPLPPLEEQKRIVAKVDVLMGLCDRLESQLAERATLIPILSRANHDRFAQDPTEAHLRAIFHEPGAASADDIRNTVRQLAVTGRLVSRWEPRDDAKDLVKKIHNERSRLEELGTIKRTSSIAGVVASDALPAIPKHWQWTRLSNITAKIGSGSTPRGGSKVYVTEGIPFLRSQNIWNDGIRLDDVVCINPETHERMGGTQVEANDVLLNITGASLGRCALVSGELGAANVSQHVTIIRPLIPELRTFIHLCLLSPFGQTMIWDRQVGMAREGLSKKVLEQFEIPLPPMDEQGRIVSRARELLNLCDNLERLWKDCRAVAEAFVNCAVREMTASKELEIGMEKPPTITINTTLTLTGQDGEGSIGPLTQLLSAHPQGLSSKQLWKQSGLEIEGFYRQLKTEMANGWIDEPVKATVKEVEAN